MLCGLRHVQENAGGQAAVCHSRTVSSRQQAVYTVSSVGKECQRIRMFSRVNGVLFSCFSISVPALARLRKMKTLSLTSYFHLQRIRGRVVGCTARVLFVVSEPVFICEVDRVKDMEMPRLRKVAWIPFVVLTINSKIWMHRLEGATPVWG